MSVAVNPVVLVPIYKPVLNEDEELSLRQLGTVLRKHQVVFIGPEGLRNVDYCRLVPDAGFQPFDCRYFSGIPGYNKLMLSRLFYKSFEAFTHILVAQTDCFVFRDELTYWCEQPYDYIGAPLYWGGSQPFDQAVCTGVGNGGFSLRRVDAALRVLNSFRYLENPLRVLRRKLPHVKSVTTFVSTVVQAGIRNNTHAWFNDFSGNEDQFWGKLAPKCCSWFRVPPPDVARHFAVEKYPRELIGEMDGCLPFGCHAWEKWGQDFWQDIINETTLL